MMKFRPPTGAPGPYLGNAFGTRCLSASWVAGVFHWTHNPTLQRHIPPGDGGANRFLIRAMKTNEDLLGLKAFNRARVKYLPGK